MTEASALPPRDKENRCSPSNGAEASLHATEEPLQCVRCQVCGDSSDPETFITCTSCNVVVHRDCYGVAPTTSAEGWQCDPCAVRYGVEDARCGLCGSGGGALLRTVEGGWCHGVCALFVPGVHYAPDPSSSRLLVHGVPRAALLSQQMSQQEAASRGVCTLYPPGAAKRLSGAQTT